MKELKEGQVKIESQIKTEMKEVRDQMKESREQMKRIEAMLKGKRDK